MPYFAIRCKVCGAEFSVPRYRLATAKACSKSCSASFSVGRTGDANPLWKGGRVVNVHGYVLVRIDGRYVYEHRHVMEALLGRKLDRSEHVHHVDGNRENNSADNLQVIPAAEHNRAHTVHRWATNSMPDRSFKLSDKEARAAAELRRKGFSWRRIGRLLGVHHGTARLAAERVSAA